MATNHNRCRLSFVDFAHPQLWQHVLEYSEMTITLTKLMNTFTYQWAKIYFLAASQLHQLAKEFRRKTDLEIRGKCSIGGRLYDLWESLLLECELESQTMKKTACLMEREISMPLETWTTLKTHQLAVQKEYRHDFDQLLTTSHEILQEYQDAYCEIYENQHVTSEMHVAHNDYLIELTGVNSFLSKYQYHVLPQFLQDMEKSQLETIETICEKIHSLASIFQDFHDQRRSSFASFVLTSANSNANEELENYLCSMKNSTDQSSAFPVHIEFESFLSPIKDSSCPNRFLSENHEHLIVYAAPVIQMHLSSCCKETIERLKQIKKEKSLLLAVINPKCSTPTFSRTSDDPQQSDKKKLHQITDLMKRKHQLRLIELEESVLLAQQDLLKTPRHSMNSVTDNHEPDAGKSRSTTTKNIKGLWRDAFQALKTSSSSSTTTNDGENRSSFVRRLSSRKKKHHHERQEDPTVIDPVYETLKIAAETRKRTLAIYLQKRQQTLNKQTSLNSQGSSEIDIQPSPRVIRHTTPVEPSPHIVRQSTTRTETELARTPSDNARISN